MKSVVLYSYYIIVCMMVSLLVYGSAASDFNEQKKHEVPSKFTKTLTVDPQGTGGYKTVQSAIDSVPDYNKNWIRILIKWGTYKEQVIIPINKGYIYLQGEGIEKTIIHYDGHEATDTSATFTSYPDYIAISGITFKNTYDVPLVTTLSKTKIVQAVAARMIGDNYVILDSSFDGLQDTLFDASGRHYYKGCFISGGIDVIFGYAQSLFEKCVLNLTVGIYAPERPYGTLTAQGRNSPDDKGGFVFKFCVVTGKGKALLGRAWEPYSRVIFYRCNFSDAILPMGWDSWNAKGQESHTTFVEYGCTGAGADKSRRVPWMRNENEKDVLNFANVGFIDQNGWLKSLPFKV